MPSIVQRPGVAESHGPRLSTKPKSLWQLLQEGLEVNPDGLALACPQHRGDSLSGQQEFTNGDIGPGWSKARNQFEWSYSQLSQKAESLAHKILGLDLAVQGFTIAPFLTSGPEWALWFWTAAKLNMPIAAVDPKVLSGHAATSPSKDIQDACIKALQPQIVIVHDDFAAVAYDEASGRNDQNPALKIIADRHSSLARPLSLRADGWITLQELISSPVSACANGNHEESADGGEVPDPEAIARILFTGGSTGDPKGCPHSHANLSAESEGFNSMRGLTPESRTLIQSPAHHIMANAAALLSWRAGAAVIFPFNGNQFDAGQSIKAIETYKCTYLPVHHSMSDAILRHPSFNKTAVKSVRFMQIGGALIGSDLAARYRDSFGVAEDGSSQLEVFPFWGSTEGMYTTACVKGDALVTDNRGADQVDLAEGSSDLLSVGRAYTGGRVKVVDPDTRTTLPRGYGSQCVGELHFGGDTVIKKYLGGVSPESFYTEDGVFWFKTGDQGRMAPDGSIFMLGRYKDMIKRGGENIFPQQLEYTLQSICAIRAQIIGIPDSVTGEACVAVVDTSKSEHFSKLQLQLDISKHVGPEFIFVHILTLEELGLGDFPVGPGGKVRKPVLKRLVLEYLNKKKPTGKFVNGTSATAKSEKSQDYWINFVKSIWADLLHIDRSQLEDDFRLEHFTDSLTAMRYCFEVERLTSKRLTVEDVRDSPTIRDQAKLISSASIETHGGGKTGTDVKQRTGPPTMADVLICRGQESKFREIQELAKPVLDRNGCTWDQDVLECYLTTPLWRGCVLLPPTRTHNLRFAFEVHGLDYSELRDALLEVLKVQPLLVSTAINLNNQLVFLQLRLSDHLLDRVITKEPQFGSVDTAVEYGLHEPFQLVAHPPELLGRFGISPISGEHDGPGPVHVVTISLSHTVCDGMTNAIIIPELDAQVRLRLAKKAGEVVSPPHISPRFIPHKLHCDMYESLDNSLAAETSRKVIASRYRGLSKEAVTPWPMFDHDNIMSIFGTDGHRGTDVYHGGINIQRSRRVPGILELQDIHGIPPSVALKVAYGLAIMQMTGKKMSLFMGIDAARHWPFQDEWTQTQLPNPLLIGGPTAVLTWERLKLEDEKVTLLDILRQTHAEDLEVAPHTHVFNSYEGILAHLPPEDAAFVRESRCFDPKIALNHVPDVGRFTGADGLKSLKIRGVSFFGTGFTPLQSGFDSRDREVCVIAGLVDDVQWDDPEREVGGFEEKILRTLGDIVKPENWDATAFGFAEPVEE
ncbi:hypothetical protein KVR01_008996 [Diaporthe batatas]|uniref:uncharacterized protein n=1 Tax=Diaporthe batatas TaxID=748121 RepID=UPI001D048615|nr:uncharacterized protein KVR01_008996 [Diaporthe batatas]KAG8160732.1 hypothetical protein KVR01_008996 [Diaporthe batatas]